MSQSLKQSSKWFSGGALNPQNLLAGMRYRLHGWMATPTKAPPESALQGLYGKDAQPDDNFRHLSFTFSVIALSASVACADGPLTRDKYIAFRESFPLKGSVCGKIRSLFTLACKSETPFEHYATQIKYMFPHQQDLFNSLVDRLFRIATADGSLSRAQERILASIAHILGVSTAEYADIRHRYDRPANLNTKDMAHHVLGVDRNVKASLLKKRYHELMQRYHPDRFAGHDVSPELQLLLKVKASEINAAYRILSRKAA